MNMIADISGMMRPLSAMASTAEQVVGASYPEGFAQADSGIADFEAEASLLLSTVARVSLAIRATPDDLVAELAADKFIDSLLEGEDKVAARFEKLTEMRSVDMSAAAAGLMDKLLGQVSGMLDRLRDARWELMVIRAERSPAPAPIAALTFEQLRDALDVE